MTSGRASFLLPLVAGFVVLSHGCDGPVTSGGRATVGSLASIGRMGPLVDPPVGTRLSPTGKGRFPAGSRGEDARSARSKNSDPHDKACQFRACASSAGGLAAGRCPPCCCGRRPGGVAAATPAPRGAGGSGSSNSSAFSRAAGARQTYRRSGALALAAVRDGPPYPECGLSASPFSARTISSSVLADSSRYISFLMRGCRPRSYNDLLSSGSILSSTKMSSLNA